MRQLAPRWVALLVVTLLATSALTAQSSLEPVSSPTFDRIQSRSYHFQEAGLDMEYQIYLPTRYEHGTPTPLIVALHGLGSTPAQIIRYQGLTALAEERGYIVAAPFGYNTRGWYGSRGEGRASDRGEAASDPDNLGALSEKDVLNVLALVREEFTIDGDRIFLMGHSMGGGGTWHLATKYPDLWAGLAPVAPAIYSSPDALQRIRHIPVIVIMGDEDPLVQVEVTREWVEKMRALGMRHQYVEIPGGDHTRLIARDPANMRKIFDFFDAARHN
jgi:poly(3-hydroxybutyrate) depolymerase